MAVRVDEGRALKPVAERLFSLFVQGDSERPPLDIGTAMVVASLLAGTRLFRNTGLDLAPGMTPGQYVLIDALNDQGIDLLNRFEAHLKTLQAEPIGEYGFEPLAGTGPTVPLLDLVRVYEPEFERIVAEERIEPGAAPEAAILAAALLVHRAQAVVDVETGTSIVVQALVHACKTAPPARPG